MFERIMFSAGVVFVMAAFIAAANATGSLFIGAFTGFVVGVAGVIVSERIYK